MSEPVRVLVVLTAQAPYTSARLRELAAGGDLDLTLALEQPAFDGHSAWRPTAIDGVEVVALGGPRLRRRVGYTASGIQDQLDHPVPLGLPRLIWQRRPHIVWLCNATQMALVSWLRPILGFRIVLTVEDTATGDRGRLHVKLKTAAYRMADLRLAFSAQALRWLERNRLGEHSQRARWSLDHRRFRPDSEARERGRQAFGIGDEVVFAFVGRLIPLKNAGALLRAWAALPAEHQRRAHLLIVGDGPERAALEALARELNVVGVSFLGYRAPEDVVCLYQAADVFVLPTLKDWFSLSLLEAMMCGCAGMTTLYNGAVELISPGRTGSMIESLEPRAFAAKLRAAIDDPDATRAMGRAAVESTTDFRNDKEIPRLRKLLQAEARGATQDTRTRCPTEDIVGFGVYRNGRDDLLEDIARSIDARDRTRILSCLNPHSAVIAAENAEFARALHDADWLVPDGIGVVLASKSQHGAIRHRITGTDVFMELQRRLNRDRGARVFFLGSTEETLDRIERRFARDFPRLRVAGRLAPPFKAHFSAADNDRMIDAIRRARPDILWVGLSAPKQEIWVHEVRHRLDVPFVANIGASFDFYAGNIHRAGPRVRNLGLEWLVRLPQDFPRLWRRTFISAPLFCWRVLMFRLRGH